MFNFFNQIEQIKSLLRNAGYDNIAEEVLEAQLSGVLEVKY